MNKKIIVAHPMKQHSFHTAIALKREGILYNYITTTYVSKKSITSRLLKFLNGNTLKKAESRRCLEIDENVIQFCEFENLIYLGMQRIACLKTFRRWYIRKVIDRFGKKVAKYAIKNNVDAVIMYDTTATSCFKYLSKKAPNIKRILDVSICTGEFMKMNFEQDMEKTGTLGHKLESDFLWNKSVMDDRNEEIRLSQYFLGASKVVKESLIYCGVNEDDIYLVPYGVDKTKFSFIPKVKEKLPLKLVFVGQITYRKGIHHLLKIISSMNQYEVELYLAGSIDKSSDIILGYDKYPNIHFKGFVTRDILPKLYQESDVFIFPSFAEGYALVILEALSCGLPCIVSNLSGGNDAIQDGYNGFTFEAGNDEELLSKIQWFIENYDKISEMSYNARNSINDLSWDEYYKNINKALKSILERDK